MQPFYYFDPLGISAAPRFDRLLPCAPAIAAAVLDDPGIGAAAVLHDGCCRRENGHAFAVFGCSGRCEEANARQHFGAQFGPRVFDCNLHFERVLLDVGFVGDTRHFAVEYGVGQYFDADFGLLADADECRIGEGDIDAHLHVLRIV